MGRHQDLVLRVGGEPGGALDWALRGMGCNPSVPVVFIGGHFVGSARDVISSHVDGTLKQRLIDANAIWF
ncbi:glutaredoxin-C11-like [Salvia divinorum]|uniref:Glutaredoxin-C11-like n=1 Tax=Salvia divinorum TaxID=28513 RepID=A0ABD1HQC7_SALDI